MGWRGQSPGIFGSLLLLVLAPMHPPAAAHAEGLRDFGDGWLLSISERALVLEMTGQPAAGKTRGSWWLGAGQGQLYALPELPLRAVECGWRQRSEGWPLSLAFAWETLGENFFLEDTKTLKLRLGTGTRIGIRVRARKWSVQREPIAAGWEVGFQGGLDFGLGRSCTGKIDLWLHAMDLPGWHGSGGRRTLADFRLFPPGFGLALRVDQKGDGSPVLALEILGRLTPRLGLGWRIDPETGSMGGTFSAQVGGLWMQTSHLVHPALGVTHRFQLGCGYAGAAPW